MAEALPYPSSGDSSRLIVAISAVSTAAGRAGWAPAPMRAKRVPGTTQLQQHSASTYAEWVSVSSASSEGSYWGKKQRVGRGWRMKRQSPGLYHCRERSSWKSCSKASEWCSSTWKHKETVKEKTLYGYSGDSRIQGYMDIQDIQALKHDLRKQPEQISPQTHANPWKCRNTPFKWSQNLTSKLQQASEKNIYTQIYCRHCHVAHFLQNSLTVCGDRVNLTHSVMLFLPNCLKPHNKTKLLPNTGHKYRGQETAAVIGNQLSHWLEQ